MEDSTFDAELVSAALAREKISYAIDRVATKGAFEAALKSKRYNVIISDFSLPGFDGLAALSLAKAVAPEVPFVFLSGTIGEDRAVESLKQGAADYVLKDRLQRLSAAILRAHTDAVKRQEQTRNEEQIRRQAELLNQARDAIFIRNNNQEIIYWNKAAERIYGWAAEEIIGKRASEILHRPGAENREEIWQAVLAKGEWSGELVQITKAGKEIVVFSHRTLLRDAFGDPVGALSINTDITEKKELENQVLRSQRMDSIGALAGGIAHDLNNMLAPILMATELLRSELNDPGQLRMLDTATASAKRGADLVRQILQFARGSKTNESAVNLRGVIEDLVKLISKTFPPVIQINTEFSDDLSTISGDATQLHQVLLNLCVNARDAMPEGGTLSIKARNIDLRRRQFPNVDEEVSGRFVELSVSDTGTGIPREILGRIFDPFFTTKSEGRGTGLGLSTVATILRNHNGFLEVESAEGRGTTFRAFLPALTIGDRSVAETAASEIPMGHGEWILLVDDEHALLEMTKELLEANNYRVLTAVNGAEALAHFEAHREQIAVVITDLLMPELGGKELIALISERSPNTLTICLSGSVDETTLLRKDQSGATAFLRKPCPTAMLLNVLAKLLGPRRAVAGAREI
ncbi:MAG TPA: response regulator [Verrucomicrobiae bacterium]